MPPTHGHVAVGQHDYNTLPALQTLTRGIAIRYAKNTSPLLHYLIHWINGGALQVNSDGNILVFNSGSSSLKFQLFEMDAITPASRVRGVVRNLGDDAICEWLSRGKREHTSVSAYDHGTAARYVLELLEHITDAGQPLLHTITAMGHRIVHGGDTFTAPILLTSRALTALDALSPLAPLHNPPALAVVRACQEHLPDIPMAAVFDTAFFHELPDYVRAYALPAEWREGSRPIRRYGFHGLAHRYMVEHFSTIHPTNTPSSRLITLQLGHGCSVAALRDGHPLETSMGFTPLEGLIMATRPGDVDIGVVLHLLEGAEVTASELSEGLNHRAGLLGLSGASADMEELLALEARGHSGAHLAIEAFCHRARKYLGAYLAVLGGADAILFGGGIGEHAPEIRARICAGLNWCGLELDTQANEAAAPDGEERISTADSRLAAYVIPVNEEALIAQDTRRCLSTALV
ncbi:acetate/propionate family kinase [Nitrosococcus oceani]|uniref:acetate/propionate family kinase n=1 Tax=Nitrosococcus oceani TaxID=1229 RepID=UPI001FD56270|nr:acetate/propionate family kinase [Nitrosococcus oceani]